MINIRQIIYSQLEPEFKQVGWLHMIDGVWALSFYISGNWVDLAPQGLQLIVNSIGLDPETCIYTNTGNYIGKLQVNTVTSDIKALDSEVKATKVNIISGDNIQIQEEQKPNYKQYTVSLTADFINTTLPQTINNIINQQLEAEGTINTAILETGSSVLNAANENASLLYVTKSTYNSNIEIINTAIDTATLRGAGWINVKELGAKGDGITDDTLALQAAVDLAYNSSKQVYIPSGVYLVTQSIFVYDGISIRGEGIYNTIIRTPWGDNYEANSYVVRDKKRYNTITNAISMPVLDLVNGHNRFYIGNGIQGYYDGDRDTNVNHPLYWPNDGSKEWHKWDSDRNTIEQIGAWVGKTGREGYGLGVFKSSQNPNIFYTEDKDNLYYSQIFPKGRVHTGVRNVSIEDLQIKTNSSNRGKDTAINFNYKASDIPSNIRETYDSSVLNIFLKGLYLFSIGGSGIKFTRAVATTISNCYIRQCAEYGIRIDGVTSINISGCYANGCLEGGYKLIGCNYSTISSCAADSCSIGYSLDSCKSISLLSCGCESTRYQKAEELGAEDLYKGRSFYLNSCEGVSLLSCYATTSQSIIQADLVSDIDAEEQDPQWKKSRHLFITTCKDVVVSNCFFKDFERVRSTPYRDSAGNKVNYQGGTYNPSVAGSRYWQIQNYLTGAQYEIRGGDDSNVRIESTKSKKDLIADSEIRTNNLDILDLGIVQNPLVSEGYSTAGKTLSTADGNGGWTHTVGDVTTVLSIDNFEFLFPINGKKINLYREALWEWRNSLVLIRKNNDGTLAEKYPTKYYGYLDVITDTYKVNGAINWSSVPSQIMNQFKIDIVSDYSSLALIDGDKDLFSHGVLSYQQLDIPVAFEPSIFTTLPALVRDKPEGCRITLNHNNIEDLPLAANKASVNIVGNKRVEATETTTEVIPGIPLVVTSQEAKADIGDKPLMHILNLAGSEFFSIFANGLGLKLGSGDRVISTNLVDYANIAKLAVSADTTLMQVINKVNSLIDRLILQGFIEAPNTNVVFTPTSSVISDTLFTFGFNIVTQIPLYLVGVAYSTTNTLPTYATNHVNATQIDSGNYQALIPRNTTTNRERYVRIFVNTAADISETSRMYSITYQLKSDGTIITI